MAFTNDEWKTAKEEGVEITLTRKQVRDLQDIDHPVMDVIIDDLDKVQAMADEAPAYLVIKITPSDI